MKGILNDNIIQLLNLRPEAIHEAEEAVEKIVESIDEVRQPRAQSKPDNVPATTEMTLEGADHSAAMDNLHNEILQHARDLMAYGFNIDHPRARGIFEIAAALYGHAITSKSSKRDAQLRAMKLALDAKRVDLEEKRTNSAIGFVDTEGAVLVEDRNELLRRIREQMAERANMDK